MADKGLNLCDERAAKCVICALSKKSAHVLPNGSKRYTHGTIANSQRTPTKINKNGAMAKVRILMEQVIL